MNKTNMLLGVALVAQVGLAFAVNATRDSAQIAPAAPIFPDLVKDAISEIEVEGQTTNGEQKVKEKVRLKKAGESFGIEGADQYPVDAAKIETFLSSLSKLKSHGVVATKSGYYDKLEVADGNFQRKVSVTANGKKYEFYLGSSPGLKQIHLRRLDDAEVLLAEGISAWDVGFKAADWVDRAYFKVPEADLWALELKNPKGSFKLEKGPDGSWALLGLPANRTLKKSAVDDLVRKVATINLETPVGKTLKPEYGLDSPQVTVQLLTGTSTVAGVPPPSTEPKQISIGAPADKGFYVKASNSEYVVVAPKWALESLLNQESKSLLEDPPKK